ncbi:hypothetical protein LTR51_002905 [Lithohypha guttulata]|nr:hypothetical protein LTR51_002905 [Lithohypha guttulata]
MGSYLPQRYPTMFKIHRAGSQVGEVAVLRNLVTGEIYPAQVIPEVNPIVLLNTLGKILDEDFLLLLPEENSTNPKYVLEAYITICPSGWNPRDKLGKRLADIHEPVPHYKEKIELSMDRFFKNLKAGKYVKRSNWSIVTSGDLFVLGHSTNHARADDKVERSEQIDPEKVKQFH